MSQQAFSSCCPAVSTDGERHVSRMPGRCRRGGLGALFAEPHPGGSGTGGLGWGLPSGGAHRVHVGRGNCERDWNQQVLLESGEKEQE